MNKIELMRSEMEAAAENKDWGQYYSLKDLIFEAQTESGDWPFQNCDKCGRVKACCQRHGHHLGDCCTHCGNDERKL